jgi:hypothetical protein
MRIAANAPVASCWVLATEEEEEADAADADAELACEDAAADVEEAEAAADEDEPELPLLASVAFRVPHFSSLLHVAWPSASSGWFAIHCTKVAWQIKKGSVCW